jgi:hypothetical protein
MFRTLWSWRRSGRRLSAVRGQFWDRVKDEGVIDSFFGVQVSGPKEAGSSDSVYWQGHGKVVK